MSTCSQWARSPSRSDSSKSPPNRLPSYASSTLPGQAGAGTFQSAPARLTPGGASARGILILFSAAVFLDLLDRYLQARKLRAADIDNAANGFSRQGRKVLRRLG